jgi:hypothetical protein
VKQNAALKRQNLTTKINGKFKAISRADENKKQIYHCRAFI